MVLSSLSKTWTIEELLTWTRNSFADAGIASPRLDAELLLADALQVSRIQLYTCFDKPIAEEERSRFRKYVARRRQREPVAYILGQKGFYGRDFTLRPCCLIPRPETELLVEVGLSALVDNGVDSARAVDVGAGSGCVGVTIAAENPDATVLLVDIERDCLDVTIANAQALGVESQISTGESDVLANVISDIGPISPKWRNVDLVISNPPYVTVGERSELQPEITGFEPEQALFAGEDGLAIIRRLVTDSPPILRPGGTLAFEFGHGQHAAVLELLDSGVWTDVAIRDDLAGIPRVARAICR